MSKYAIVILYEGLQPSGRTMEALCTALAGTDVVSDLDSVEMYKMSEEEVIAAIAVKPMCGDSNFFTVKSTVNQSITPEAKAVIEISKRYGEKIAKGDMYDLFYKMLLDAKSKTDNSLTEAIYVLSREGAEDHIGAKTKKDAALWSKVIDVIRKVYVAVYVLNVSYYSKI